MRSRSIWMLAAGLACALLCASACSSPNNTAPNNTTPAAARQPVARVDDTKIADDLPRLAAGVSNSPRPPEVVRALYEFAARHPEVLDYVPCFCGCERGGHKGNADCFVGRRDKSGHVTQWDTHALVCEVCLDVAQQAMQMHNSGASTLAIRQAIDARYTTPGGFHTPTPMPPHGGGSDD